MMASKSVELSSNVNMKIHIYLQFIFFILTSIIMMC